jgi:large subunit ribosomal protein L19
MNVASLIEVKSNSNIPDIAPGDTVKVSVKVVEGDKERIQAFQGVVLKLRNGADGGSFTVRRVTHGVGVERTFLFRSPLVEKVEVVRRGKVRRARLYYLRERSGKAARIREKRQARGKEQEES